MENIRVIVAKTLVSTIKKFEKGRVSGAVPELLDRTQKLSKALANKISSGGVDLLGRSNLVVKFHAKYNKAGVPTSKNPTLALIDDTGDIVFRGTDDEVVFFLVNKLELVDNPAKFLQRFKNLLANFRKFDPNGSSLRNAGYTDLVPSAPRGLSPDFSKTPQYLFNGKAIQTIKLTGSRGTDDIIANRLAGLDGTPLHHSWHHLDDFDPLDRHVYDAVGTDKSSLQSNSHRRRFALESLV